MVEGSLDNVVSPEVQALVRDRAPKCFLCLWILRDLERYGKLSGGPEDYAGTKTFPVASQVKHLVVEGFLPKPGKV